FSRGATYRPVRAERATEFRCPLLGVKRTLIEEAAMSAFDPKRTLNVSFGFRRHSTDLRIAGSQSHLSRIDGENFHMWITTMHVRLGHGCKRWHLRPMIDYLVD